jgi:hypothetical protein
VVVVEQVVEVQVWARVVEREVRVVREWVMVVLVARE